MRIITAALATTILATGAIAQDEPLSGTLRIFSDMSNPAPRAVMEGMAARFEEMHPDLDVEVTIIDREAYKTQIRNFLSANPPDVANWYAGNRMAPYVEAGLFEDVSDLWAEPEFEALASTKGALTLDDKQWGVPYTYYQWGVYFREDIYGEHGLEPPQDWEAFLAACQTLLDADVKCFTIGTKFLWTAAGWFDYLNLRTNGYDFHMAADERRGGMDRRPRAPDLRPLARADRHGRLHRRPHRLLLAGGAARSWSRATPRPT